MVGSGLQNYTRGYHVHQDIWEANKGEQLLFQRENGNCADPFAVTPGCQEGTLGSSAFDERCRPCFLLVMLLLCILVCSLPHPSHARQLEKGGPEYRGHSQCGASSKKEAYQNVADPNLTMCRQRYTVCGKFRGWKILWMENFVTPG